MESNETCFEELDSEIDVASKPSVLIVSRGGQTASLVTCFRASGYYVLTAESPVLCIELCESIKPDVVISSSHIVKNDCMSILDGLTDRFQGCRPVVICVAGADKKICDDMKNETRLSKVYSTDAAEDDIVRDATEFVEEQGMII